jgi:hypothetical protein
MNIKTKASALLGFLAAIIIGLGLTGCAQKKDLPITVSFRKAMLDSSLVAQIHNNSDVSMKVLVKIHNRTTKETKQGEFIIPAKGQEEIGWAEGWRFVPGEAIEVTHADYKDLKVTVP